MKREQRILVGNTNKNVSQCSPSIHTTLHLYRREDRTYYWQHCRKDEEDRFLDVDNLQLELLGDPVLSKEFIMKSLYG